MNANDTNAPDQQPADAHGIDVPQAEAVPVDADGATGSAAEAERMRLLAENEQLQDRVARTQAELENFRRRVRKEQEDAARYEGSRVILKLLPVQDNLSRALQAATDASAFESLKIGVQMVSRQFDEVLQQIQVRRISSAGAPFDPNLHEAIGQLPHPTVPEMTVIEEVEAGYQLHDRVLRPAKVLVSQGPPMMAGDG